MKANPAILIADKNVHAGQQIWDLLKNQGFTLDLEASLAIDPVKIIIEDRAAKGSEATSVGGVIIAHTFEEEGDGLATAKQIRDEYRLPIVVAVEEGQAAEDFHTICKPYQLLKKRGLNRVLKPIKEAFAAL